MLVLKVWTHWSLCIDQLWQISILREHLLIQILDVFDHHLVSMVVDEDVNATHLLDSRLDDLLAVLALFQVGRVCVALLTLFLDKLHGLLCIVFLLRQVCNKAVGTLHGVEYGNRATDPAVAASDECLLALELAGGLVEFAASVSGGEVVNLWRWVHDCLPAGHLLVLDLGLVACGVVLDSDC
jgi:hypothetical protein